MRALVAVGLLVGGIYLVLPLVQGNCQDWYHRVAFIAREFGENDSPGVSPQARSRQAIEEVGAKPFYCN